MSHEAMETEGVDESQEATFALEGEDHTLGNALRWMLNKNPHVALAAFSVPHPSDEVVNVRVQTTGEISATTALRSALMDVSGLCDHLSETMTQRMSAHEGR
mmetsp:Transcript_28493/g.93092  ORF Transcript_28493/g.93092 Transcript_28493/m.93092 type:complete len:102 (-) Transcript_28493:77-382(-)